MAPANAPEDSGSPRDTNSKNNSNPFVSFRHGVDNFAASIFTDLADIFPSLQRYAPIRSSNAFDERRREFFRKFNDSYERATNPERKRIERMSCPDDDNNNNGGSDEHGNDNRYNWGGQMKPEASLDVQSPSTDGPSADARSPSSTTAEFHTRDPYDSLRLPPRSIHGYWRPCKDYILDSPYSPLQLEVDSLTASDGQRWRVAFEDLLRVDHARPLTRAAICIGRPVRETPQNWLSRLAFKGFTRDIGSYPILHDAFALSRYDSPLDDLSFESKADQLLLPSNLRENFAVAQQVCWDLPDDATGPEKLAAIQFGVALGFKSRLLDFKTWVEHGVKSGAPAGGSLLGLLALAAGEDEEYADEEEEDEDDEPDSPGYMNSTVMSQRSISMHDFSQNSENEKSGKGILESSTTTERRVLPDGSVLVHTKLKKKFTDGTEWNDETTTLKAAGDENHGELPHYDRTASGVTQSFHAEKAGGEHNPIMQALKEQQPLKKRENATKGGWFWSY